jgi:hypothetical protein
MKDFKGSPIFLGAQWGGPAAAGAFNGRSSVVECPFSSATSPSGRPLPRSTAVKLPSRRNLPRAMTALEYGVH